MEKKPSKPVDLREYEAEAVPFDTVIRRLGAKPVQPPKAKPKKPAARRK